MKLTKSTDFRIAKDLLDNVSMKTASLEYDKWVDFIDNHSNYFCWNENTEEGKRSLQNIQNVPLEFRERVLSTLNKGMCHAEWDNKKQQYNISLIFYESLNWITIQFSRTPKINDLKIYVEMANHLDALLLKDGTEIIDEEIIKNLS